MSFFVYTIDDSDGNDNTVYESVIEADSKDAADEIISAHFESEAKSKDWESDGDGGYYYPCDCEQPSEPEYPVTCDQCEVLVINGHVTHEHGCPVWNRFKRELRAAEMFECPGHGGLTIHFDGVPQFEDEDEAHDSIASYHSEYAI